MKFKNFAQFFSTSRINRYLIATGNSNKNAIKLYKNTLKIAQSFHPLLGVLEVVLRNQINNMLIVHFADNDWIINQKKGFMIDPSLTFIYKKTGKKRTNDFLLREVKKAEMRFHKSGTPITSGKIIAEQTLAFWTDLFEVHNYKLLKGKPIQIFKTLPAGFGRKEVNDELTKIRQFRNRVNHNEPICFLLNTIDFNITKEVHQSILNVLSWIDPELIKWIKELDTVVKYIEIGNKIGHVD